MIIIIIIIICLQCVTDHEALTISASSSSSTAPPSMAKLGCDDHCGNISIPYPFGIWKRCYHNIEWFSINCDNSSNPPKPFLNHSKLNLEVLNIDIYRKRVTVNSPIPSNCGNGSEQDPSAGSSSTSTSTGNWRSSDLRGSPFLYPADNDLMAVGCVNVLLTDGDGNRKAGCTSFCNDNAITAKDCSFGINCCSTQVGELLDVYSLSTTAVSSTAGRVGRCTSAFLAYNCTPSYNNISQIINAVGGDAKYTPLELYWLFPEPLNSSGCSDETFYTSWRNYSNYYCVCDQIEEGNPYLPMDVDVIFYFLNN